jgi:hypothetical protein
VTSIASASRILHCLRFSNLFAGNSTFQSRDPSFQGIASLVADAISVDRRPGPNEIVLAVSEKFGGWGFAARLEPFAAEHGR